MKIDLILGAGRTATEINELGQLAEHYGLQTFWNQSFPSRRDPLLTMANLAVNTSKIRLGTLPVSPYEIHPQRIADTILTFNELCGGRSSILIGGLGHSVSRVTGLQPERRITAVRDCVTALKGIHPEKMTQYEGDCYSLMNYQAEWAVDKPPEIYVGSTGPQMLKMAAQVADGIMMSDAPLGKMKEVLTSVSAGLEQAGRAKSGLKLNNFFAWHIKEDRDESFAEARRELIWRGLLQAWFTEPFLGAETAGFVESNKDAFLNAFLAHSDQIQGVPDDIIDALIENLTFAGGLDAIDKVIEHIRAFEAAGLDEIALKVHDNPAEAIRIIGERIVPAFA